MSFYVGTQEYVGPLNYSTGGNLDNDRIFIWRTPIENANGQVILHGTVTPIFNQTLTTAYGSYETLEEAMEFVNKNFHFRYLEREVDGWGESDYINLDDDIVRIFKLGQYVRMSHEVMDAFYDGLDCVVHADTTDDEIDAMLQADEKFVNEEWEATLDQNYAREFYEVVRERLRAEAGYNDENDDDDDDDDDDDVTAGDEVE